jgi:hypothetical protein
MHGVTIATTKPQQKKGEQKQKKGVRTRFGASWDVLDKKKVSGTDLALLGTSLGAER